MLLYFFLEKYFENCCWYLLLRKKKVDYSNGIYLYSIFYICKRIQQSTSIDLLIVWMLQCMLIFPVKQQITNISCFNIVLGASSFKLDFIRPESYCNEGLLVTWNFNFYDRDIPKLNPVKIIMMIMIQKVAFKSL